MENTPNNDVSTWTIGVATCDNRFYFIILVGQG